MKLLTTLLCAGTATAFHVSKLSQPMQDMTLKKEIPDEVHRQPSQTGSEPYLESERTEWAVPRDRDAVIARDTSQPASLLTNEDRQWRMGSTPAPSSEKHEAYTAQDRTWTFPSAANARPPSKEVKKAPLLESDELTWMMRQLENPELLEEL